MLILHDLSWLSVLLTFVQVSPDQVIHAPTPVKLLTDLHDKHTLVIGQEHRLDIAAEYPFSCVTDWSAWRVGEGVYNKLLLKWHTDFCGDKGPVLNFFCCFSKRLFQECECLLLQGVWKGFGTILHTWCYDVLKGNLIRSLCHFTYIYVFCCGMLQKGFRGFFLYHLKYLHLWCLTVKKGFERPSYFSHVPVVVLCSGHWGIFQIISYFLS